MAKRRSSGGTRARRSKSSAVPNLKRQRVLWAFVGAVGFFVLVLVSIAVNQWANWPDVAALASSNPQTTAFIERYRERKREAGESDRVAWEWVSWNAISIHLKRAVVVAEDIEFFSHNGFSAAEIKVAIREAIEEREAPRGASTITQQLAKNLWLSPSRSPFRKLKEVALTRDLEDKLPKNRILEIYLNVVEFGSGIYGAEAAAQYYFGKPAAFLTERESAKLAASLPRPSRWNPHSESEYYARYVSDIERRMERADFLWRRLGVALNFRLVLPLSPLSSPVSAI